MEYYQNRSKVEERYKGRKRTKEIEKGPLYIMVNEMNHH